MYNKVKRKGLRSAIHILQSLINNTQINFIHTMYPIFLILRKQIIDREHLQPVYIHSKHRTNMFYRFNLIHLNIVFPLAFSH